MFRHIFFITTYQYPILEHICNDINYLSSKGEKILVINLNATNNFFRSDMLFKNLTRFGSLKIRNSSFNPRVRKLLNEINKNPIKYIDNLEIAYGSKIDEKFKKLVYFACSNFLRCFDNSYFIDSDRSGILYRKVLYYFKNFYKYFVTIAENNSKSLIHVFNGRFPMEYILINQFFKSNKIIYYECNDFNFKCLRKLSSVHNLKGFFNETKTINNKISKSLKREFVSELIKYKRKDKIYSKKKYDFIFFTTNLDEYVFTGHVADQVQLILKYLNSFPKNSNVAIRLHPNTSTKMSFDRFYWDKFSNYISNFGIDVFSYNSNIDSYSLSDKNTLSFSMGSTIGGELIYEGNNHHFISDFNPFSLDEGVVKIDPKDIQLNGFPKKPITKKKNIDKNIIASALMLPFFIGEDFDYKINRMSKNPIYKYMYNKFDYLLDDKNLTIGISQKQLLEINY